MSKAIKMIEDLMCPGCTNGSSTNCGKLKIAKTGGGGFRCESHSAGTFLMGGMVIMLGMPTGFNRVRRSSVNKDIKQEVVLFEDNSWLDKSDRFDMVVWKAKHNGRTFLKVLQPRISHVETHVVDNEEAFDMHDCLDVTNLEMD